MSDFFATEQDTQQAKIDATVRASLEGERDPTLGELLDEFRRGAGEETLTGLAWAADAAAFVSNLPNTAFATPDYLLPEDPIRREATRRRIDPHYNDVTPLARHFQETRDWSIEYARSLRTDRAARSEAAAIVNGLGRMVPALVTGGLQREIGAALWMAGSGYEGEKAEMLASGASPEVAEEQALQTAMFNALSGVAPVSLAGTGRTLPTRIFQRALSGSIINFGVGAAQRYSAHEYLTEQGYGAGSENDLASRYQWLDPAAATIDGIFGAAFGGLFGHALPDSARAHAVVEAPAGAAPPPAGGEPPSAGRPPPAGGAPPAGEAPPPPPRVPLSEDTLNAMVAWQTAQRALDEYVRAHAEAGDLSDPLVRAEIERLHGAATVAGEAMMHSRQEDHADAGQTPDGEQRLPEDADGYFDEARLYAHDEQFPEAYAYALIADDLGHPHARELIEAIETDPRITEDDLDRGRAIASDIARAEVGSAVHQSDASPAAWVDTETVHDATVIGVPVDDASARWRDAQLERVKAQAEHGEPIAADPMPDDVDFVPLPPRPDVDAHMDGALLDFAHELAAQGDPVAAVRLRELQEQQRARGIEPEADEIQASLGRRGVDPHRGDAPFHDPRLKPQQNKAVEMARNNFTNEEIAEELGVRSTQRVRELLTKAAARLGGRSWDAQASGAGPGVVTQTLEKVPPIESLVRLRDQLVKAGFKRHIGGRVGGDYNINGIIAQRLGMTRERVGDRLARYDRDVAAGRREAIQASMGKDKGSNIADLTAVAAREFGVTWDWLQRASKANMHESFDALPPELQALARKTFGEEGAEDLTAFVHWSTGADGVRRGQAHFIADRISPDEFVGKVLHEIGVHMGIERMLGPEVYAEISSQLVGMIDAGHPLVVAAMNQAMRDAGIEGLRSEGIAYTVEMLRKDTLANLLQARTDIPLVNRVLAAVRQFLIKTFGPRFAMRLQLNELRNLAVAALRQQADVARVGAEGITAPPRDVEAVLGHDAIEASFGGPHARTANHETRALAREMERAGKDEWFIWHNTGWARGVDGQWRFEIPDEGAAFKIPWATIRRRKGAMFLPDIFDHPELYKAYPILQDVVVLIDDQPGVGGAWHLNDGTITLSPRSGGVYARQTMLHEIQHAIQDIEGFAAGADWTTLTNAQRMEAVRADAARRIEGYQWVSPETRARWISEIDERMETYRYAMGEAEARAVERRQPEDYGIPPGEAVRNQVANPALLWSPRRRNWEVFRSDRQNRSDLLGEGDARSERPDTLDAPAFRDRVGRVQESLKGTDAGPARRAQGAAALARAAANLKERARQAVSVSGVRVVKKPTSQADFGAFRMTVEAPIDLPKDVQQTLIDQVQGRDHNTVIGFDIVRNGEDAGRNNAPDPRPEGVHVKWTSVADDLRGSGVGEWMYRQLVDWAHARGFDVYSDDVTLSKRAWRMYEETLPARGYETRRVGDADWHHGAQTWEVKNEGEPAWVISRSAGEKAAYDRAPTPEGGYRINPKDTLRERWERSEAARERDAQASMRGAAPTPEARLNTRGPIREPKGETYMGVVEEYTVPNKMKDAPVPVRGGGMILNSTNAANADMQSANLDALLAKHKNPFRSLNAWMAYANDAFGITRLPMPPWRTMQIVKRGADLVAEEIGKLSPGMVRDAEEGLATAQRFGQLYAEGNVPVHVTAKAFLWSFLSRGVSPYVQEGAFLDVVSSPEAVRIIEKAVADGWSPELDAAWTAFAERAIPPGSPGRGTQHNLNAYGRNFLRVMTTKHADAGGRTGLQIIHDMVADGTPSYLIRREFLKRGAGAGIDNKVVSFTLLLLGRTDVIVLDRVQVRNQFDDGRFKDENIYDTDTDADGKQINGTAFAEITFGHKGLLYYEAMERQLKSVIEQAYAQLGREGSLGRYHWDSWLLASDQEVGHSSVEGLLAEAEGKANPYAGTFVRQGKYQQYDYGFRYTVLASGERATVVAGLTKDAVFILPHDVIADAGSDTRRALSRLADRAKARAKTEGGGDTRPWTDYLTDQEKVAYDEAIASGASGTAAEADIRADPADTVGRTPESAGEPGRGGEEIPGEEVGGPARPEAGRPEEVDPHKAQEEYDELPPVEQALADDSEMQGSMSLAEGRMPRRARDELDDAKQEAKSARAMSEAFNAAAKCAARQAATRSFISAAAPITRAAAADQALGHFLGLAASVPAGIVASNLVAQRADPRGYALRRAETARQNWVAASHRAAVATGLDTPAQIEVGGDYDGPPIRPGHASASDYPIPSEGSAHGLPPPDADLQMPDQDEALSQELIRLFGPLVEDQQ
jgi:GNAT superfamily N-acetyltransferase